MIYYQQEGEFDTYLSIVGLCGPTPFPLHSTYLNYRDKMFDNKNSSISLSSNLTNSFVSSISCKDTNGIQIVRTEIYQPL